MNRVEGKNDGLVTTDSAFWGNFKGIWKGGGTRGISHADSVDFRRRRFSKKSKTEGVKDICDCYAEIVSNLKDKGLQMEFGNRKWKSPIVAV